MKGAITLALYIAIGTIGAAFGQAIARTAALQGAAATGKVLKALLLY